MEKLATVTPRTELPYFAEDVDANLVLLDNDINGIDTRVTAVENWKDQRIFHFKDSTGFLNVTTITPTLVPGMTLTFVPPRNTLVHVSLSAQVRVLNARTTNVTFNSMLLVQVFMNGNNLGTSIQVASNEAGFYAGGLVSYNRANLTGGVSYTFEVFGLLLNTTGGGTWNIGDATRLVIEGK